ncbi:MAG: hypothetical protein JWO96_524 [Candidatus Saccharibacteria bacterium]|nr:hypothetical protein [Candidatus Saccharibacteria bacterium]
MIELAGENRRVENLLEPVVLETDAAAYGEARAQVQAATDIFWGIVKGTEDRERGIEVLGEVIAAFEDTHAVELLMAAERRAEIEDEEGEEALGISLAPAEQELNGMRTLYLGYLAIVNTPPKEI